MARERDFFRLNKQDRGDLLKVLNRNIIIPEALTKAHETVSLDAFNRLFNKFQRRLTADQYGSKGL